MDPSQMPSSNPNSDSDVRGGRPKNLAFYETPEHVITSAKIISEARSSLGHSNLKPLNTRRPETPQDGQRKLFGDQSIRDPTNRPPSAFSLGSHHFDSDVRPLSGQRLLPLDHKQRTSQSDAEVAMAPKPPTDPNRAPRRSGSRQRLYQHSTSVDSSPSEPMPKTGSLTDVSTDEASSRLEDQGSKRAHSGPRERTAASEDLQFSKPASRRLAASSSKEESVESEAVRPTNSSSKPGSAGREESREEAQYYETHIGPIVQEMTTHLKGKDPERLSELAVSLYRALEDGGLLGKACKRRPLILKTVFKLLDLESPRLLLSLASLIFALRVSGNNLVNVCKLVFKVSRDDKNDSCFLEGHILDLVIDTVSRTEHTTAPDALVYCVGALKFLSGNTKIVKHLLKRQCMAVMATLLSTINSTSGAGGVSSEQSGHILVQLTAVLRNFADVSGTRHQFLSLGLVEELCAVMTTYTHDGDLMLNLARIYSKLTLHTDCCMRVAGLDKHYPAFITLLQKYQRREDLVVRVCFVLGNLTAKDDGARHKLMDQPRALDTLLSTLKYYSDLDHKGGAGKTAKTEDVLVKVIRVVANLCMSEEHGTTLASNDACLHTLLTILERKSVEGSEELVLNTIATINNLSFYNLQDSAITRSLLPTAQAVLQFMEASHMEGLAEATRVLGNLSRHKAVRDYLLSQKVDEAMVAMLDSGDREVVFTACGVLINLLIDEDKRSILTKHGGVGKLVEVLCDFGRSDWQLASLVCQTLWNHSAKITSVNSSFGEEYGTQLHNILLEYLDEGVLSENSDFNSEMQLYVEEVWQTEFVPVATKLLNRIEAHQSNFEPLEDPS